MASLKIESGQILSDLNEIRTYLKPLNIELSNWPIEKTEAVGDLLFSDSLNDEQKEQLLVALDDRFLDQKNLYGYQSRDLIVLHPEMPQLNDLLNKFNKCHRHDDDEVRYIIDGQGIFGFIMPNQEQVQLTVDAEEYIRVPAMTEHWFVLTETKRIKAVRYFTSKDGWVANYTGTERRA